MQDLLASGAAHTDAEPKPKDSKDTSCVNTQFK